MTSTCITFFSCLCGWARVPVCMCVSVSVYKSLYANYLNILWTNHEKHFYDDIHRREYDAKSTSNFNAWHYTKNTSLAWVFVKLHFVCAHSTKYGISTIRCNKYKDIRKSPSRLCFLNYLFNKKTKKEREFKNIFYRKLPVLIATKNFKYNRENFQRIENRGVSLFW